MADAVDAGCIILGSLLVAWLRIMSGAAIRSLELSLVHKVLDPFVAIHTREFAVNRFVKAVRRENCHRNRFAFDLPGVGRVGMAIQAIRIG